MNQTLEQYLQVYCNYQQDNWAEPSYHLLSAALQQHAQCYDWYYALLRQQGLPHPNITVSSQA